MQRIYIENISSLEHCIGYFILTELGSNLIYLMRNSETEHMLLYNSVSMELFSDSLKAH